MEDDYFVDYQNISVHECMLKDAPRLLAGRSVLDVGTGTGILAMMAAKYGAGQVIAVEASDVAGVTQQIVESNGFGSKIKVVKARVEQLELSERVDIIVSEWMGFHLLHEGMLASVLWARDHLLAPGGIMIPNEAAILAAPVELARWRQEHVLFWRSVMGFDMSALEPYALSAAAASPAHIVMNVEEKEVIADAQTLAALDLRTVPADELARIERTMRFAVRRPAMFHGICIWFSVKTAVPGAAEVCMATAPSCPATHWKQTVLHVPGEAPASEGDVIECSVSMEADAANPRHYSITMDEVSLLPPATAGSDE
eukprot:m51a1_g4605 putative hmt1p (313) ;mRNA; r:241371-242507